MTSYFDIYFNQLFTTLGQLTGLLISSSVVVPMYTYYSRRLILDQLRERVHKKQFSDELRELVAEHEKQFQQEKENKEDKEDK